MAENRDDFIISIRYALLKKGAKQKFSLFFLILLSISIVTLDKFSPPFMSTIRAVLNDVVYHMSVVSSQPTRLKKYLFIETKKHYNTLEENKFLKKEIEFFKQQKFNNAFLESENEILKNALGISINKSYTQDVSIVARVILDQESPFLKSVLINKGSRNEVIKGMTVFYKDYLLGTIIETNYLTSRVLLLTDLNSKLPVLIENTEVNAILEGTGNKKDLNLAYLPDQYKIEPNQLIFTSGKDGFLVPGIPVAESYLDQKNKVLIKLLADPDQALIVHVTNGQINR